MFDGLSKVESKGKRVDLKLKHKGVTKAKVDFLVEGEGVPSQPIAKEKLGSASATLQAPSGYSKPIWVCAWYYVPCSTRARRLRWPAPPGSRAVGSGWWPSPGDW